MTALSPPRAASGMLSDVLLLAVVVASELVFTMGVVVPHVTGDAASDAWLVLPVFGLVFLLPMLLVSTVVTSAQRLVLGAPLAPGLRQINVAILLMSLAGLVGLLSPWGLGALRAFAIAAD
jgi:hypothetical protein